MTLDEAVLFEEFVGGRDGGAVQSKQTSQFASGGETFALGEATGLDEGSDLLVQLAVKRDIGLRIQNQCGEHRW